MTYVPLSPSGALLKNGKGVASALPKAEPGGGGFSR